MFFDNLITEPKVKQQKRKFSSDLLCRGIKSNGDRCSFKSVKNTSYCKHHIPKLTQKNIETNTCNEYMVDSTTNTDGTMLDITTANKVIIGLIADRVEHEKQITELIDMYNELRDQLEQLQSI